MYGYVYKTTNLVNNKIYVGQHKGNNFDSNYIGSGLLLRKAINKYGIKNFKCEIIQYCDTKNNLDEKEKYWINFFQSYKRKIGYNISSGGQGGNLLLNMTCEQKRSRSIKISNSLKGHYVSSETKLKIAEGNKKYWEDHYEELCMKNKEIRQKEEVRKAISDSKKEYFKKNPEKKINISTRQKDIWNSDEYRQQQHLTRSSERYKNLMSSKLKGKTLGYITINDGTHIKRLPKKDAEDYLNKGWVLGTLPFSEATKKKMSEARKRNNRGTTNVKIECLTTHQVFNSKKEAVERLGLSMYQLNKALELNIEIKGLMLRKIDKEGD